MSPEQMRSSQAADARSDIWGLGVVAFELLTGARPFAAESLTELVLVINQEPPIDPKTLRPDLPDQLCRVILRCLEKDPNRRFASIAELAAELAQFGSRDSRMAARDIKSLNDQVKIPGAPATGRLGTLIVGTNDHPELAQLAAMGESSLGASSVGPSLAGNEAESPPAPAGSMTSAPWASTNDDEAKQRGLGVKQPKGGVGLIIALAGAASAITIAGLVLFLMRDDAPDNSDIASAASELENAQSQNAARRDDVSALDTKGAQATPGPADATSATTAAAPSESSSASAEPEERQPPKRAAPRPRPKQPKSAKERLGF
jgi:serine/threonine-protein kinase